MPDQSIIQVAWPRALRQVLSVVLVIYVYSTALKTIRLLQRTVHSQLHPGKQSKTNNITTSEIAHRAAVQLRSERGGGDISLPLSEKEVVNNQVIESPTGF